MIYMVGADLESKNGLATVDLDSINYNSMDNENINVVLIAGGATKWHNNYINKLGIDVDKHRKKGSLFKVREKTIGLIKEDWNYNKVEDSTIKQISSQIDPKKYNKLISDKKDDVILIQKYKGNYYNVPNDNNELETSED